MTNLINGRTPEEIITGLKCEVPCHKCAYKDHNFMKDDSCSYYVEQDIIALIKHLESERDAALAKVPRWISVEEQLPEPGTVVLVFAPKYSRWSIRHAEYSINCRWNAVRGEHITHWMPLPEPPEVEHD